MNIIKRHAVLLILILGIIMSTFTQANTEDQGKVLKIAVDTGRLKEPISKYIYGQFIEHLGRCIYGGIWAEMLEDRKFFFPVSENPDTPWKTTKKGAKVLARTPWKVIGADAHTVRKVKEKGKDAPETSLKIDIPGESKPAGIYQKELALINGKDYTGRILLAGTPNAGPVKVSLVWGETKKARHTIEIKKIKNNFTAFPLKFKAGASTDDARLEITAQGDGSLRIAAVSLMPADNIKGFRADTLALLRELNSPVYRWPGGNFVSGYDWKDGIGDPDKRPTRRNPAWTGLEYNDVGIHEFMTFCELVNAEPFIAVNTGKGDAKMAVEEVEYCNGKRSTPMGKLRAANGHAEPFNVKWWAIGNEMYGKWQIGHMPLEEYVKKHNKVVDAMRAVDPSIVPIGVGKIGKWSKAMLSTCKDHMDLISEHFYCRKKKSNIKWHISQIRGSIKRIVKQHRKYRSSIKGLEEKNIRIAMDEWNYWHKKYIPMYGELGCRYDLKDALGIGAGLHEYFRNSDIIFMANYAQTVNVIGCIKTSKTAAVFATTGLVLKLYRKEFGRIPIAIDKQTPLDISIAWTEDRKALTVGIINPADTEYTVALDIKGALLSGRGKKFWITGESHDVYNEPHKDPKVKIMEENITEISQGLKALPLSVTLYRLNVK